LQRVVQLLRDPVPQFGDERLDVHAGYQGAEQTAVWDVGAVLSVTADTAGEDLTNEILLQLPAGYDLLFGRPEGAGTRRPAQG
ncbi:hypothetical protein ABZ371_31710, partial [Streptomyces sp. NPDC005899]